MIQYYAGEWKDHKIVFVNENSEKLLFDGKPIAENKPGIRFSATLAGELPTGSDISVFAHLEGCNCACVVGKILETLYDKDTKTFYTEYNGHKIECNNKKMKAAMFIDGKEVDKEDNGIHSYQILGSAADENGKRIMAAIYGEGLKLKCTFIAEAENVKMVMCQKQGGELVPVSASDSFGVIYIDN